MTVVLFWDIDGTLLDTKWAGIIAWEEATAAVMNRSIDLSEFKTAGLTDIEIGGLILEHYGSSGVQGSVDEIVRLYEGNLPKTLPRRNGLVLPNVRQILEMGQGHQGLLSLLLTGNTRAGGRAKLTHFGLSDYFVDGAFADDTTDRVTIAHNAMALADTLLDGTDMSAAYVIGDTPKDILCAHAIEARAVAVATGIYDVSELEAHSPWWAVPELPPAEEFIATVLSHQDRHAAQANGGPVSRDRDEGL